MDYASCVSSFSSTSLSVFPTACTATVLTHDIQTEDSNHCQRGHVDARLVRFVPPPQPARHKLTHPSGGAGLMSLSSARSTRARTRRASSRPRTPSTSLSRPKWTPASPRTASSLAGSRRVPRCRSSLASQPRGASQVLLSSADG